MADPHRISIRQHDSGTVSKKVADVVDNEVDCPHCQTTYETEGSYAVMAADCEACGNTFIIRPIPMSGLPVHQPGTADSATGEKTGKFRLNPNLDRSS